GALGLRTLFPYRQTELWHNTKRSLIDKTEIGVGDVFDVRSVGPFIVSVSDRGALAESQWINGRQSFLNQRLGAISFFGTAGRSPNRQSVPLMLSLDA